MNTKEQAHFDKLYNLHLRTLKLRGMSDNTIDSYARAVRRVSYNWLRLPLPLQQCLIFYA